MRERRFRSALVDKVLATPRARVIGLDSDPDVLQRAVRKGRAVRVEPRLLQAMADAIPARERAGRLRRQLARLSPPRARYQETRALAAVRRVLRPDGHLIFSDWGRPQDPVMRVAFLAVPLLDEFDNTRQHVAEELPHLINNAGLTVETIDRLRSVAGNARAVTRHAGSPFTTGGPMSSQPRVALS